MCPVCLSHVSVLFTSNWCLIREHNHQICNHTDIDKVMELALSQPTVGNYNAKHKNRHNIFALARVADLCISTVRGDFLTLPSAMGLGTYFSAHESKRRFQEKLMLSLHSLATTSSNHA